VARLAAAWGDPKAATRLLGAAVSHRAYRRASTAHDASQVTEDPAALRAALGEEVFASAWAEGAAMSFDEAVADALALEPPPMARAQSSPLTPREKEVARLIAEGRSNREIARALVIAEPTVERHVANIMHKLGVHARAQIAVWVTKNLAGR
jgi:non-specific serine/threonine protein kinase